MFTIQSLHVAMEIWGAIFCALAAFCMFYNTGMDARKRKILMYMELASALLMANDAMAWGFRGYPGKTGYWMVRISNFFVFLISDLILWLVHTYVCMNIFDNMPQDTISGKIKGNTLNIENTQKNKTGFNYFDDDNCPKRVKLVYILGLIGIFFVILTQFMGFYYHFDANNFYHRSKYHPVSIVIGMIAMAIDMSLLVQYRKNMKKQIFISIMSYFVLPFMAAISLLFIYGISLLNIAITISMICMFVVAIVEQGKELSDARVDLMMSQIQPHFLYNTLSTISVLCKRDPQKAEQVTVHFAKYLRGNLENMGDSRPVPFGKELEHIRTYLWIEQVRFQEELSVAFHIETEDFMIPSLSVQPIVENAVKHGMMGSDKNCAIIIETKDVGNFHEIIISDDGCGFDVNAPRKNDGRKHIGIDSVRKRLETMVGGSLDIESEVGKGTIVTIRIPRQ